MSFGIPVRNGLAIGLLSSTMLSSRAGMSAALMLNFLTGSLDPRITFSRGSQATLTDSTGKITFAPNNLLTNSESFEAAAWNAYGGALVVTANTVTSPDGTTTADTITLSNSFKVQTVTSRANVPHIFSVWMRTDSGTKNVQLRNVEDATASMKTVTTSWQRFDVVFTPTVSTVSVGIDQRSGASPSQSGIIYVWGAQLEQVTYQTTPSTYNSTTPKNLLGYTQEFDNAAWTKTNSFVQTNLLLQSQFAASWTSSAVTLTANAATAPNGTSTAASLADNATSGPHVAFQTIGTTSSLAYTASVYAKAGTGRYLTVAVVNGLSTGSATATFDLQTGSVTQSGTYGVAATFISASATDVGGGWYRLTVVSSNTTSNITLQVCGASAGTFAPDVFGRNSYSGTGSTWLIWGAQLVQGATAGNYQPTYAAAAAVQYAAPDGSTTADQLSESAVAGQHELRYSYTFTASTPYVLSVYAKANGRNLLVYVDGFSGGQNFDLSAGTVGSSVGTAPSSASITNMGNGWYRCSIGFTWGVGATNNIRLITLNGTTNSYTGDGTSGIYVWGAQLSNSASLDPYVYNPGAAPTSAAYYGPRFDYDPVTLAAKGLLIEEQRTNLLTYSEQFDNAAWTKTAATITANSAVAPDGTTTADTITEDTTAVSAHRVFTTITASAAAYTASIYVKAGTRSWCYIRLTDSGAVQRYAYFNVSTGTLGTVETNLTASITPAGNGWYRCSATVNVAATSLPVIFAITDGNNSQVYTGNGTGSLYFWGAQAEAGAFATSYIPTVASQVTRSADIATMVGANFSNWYNVNEGTAAVAFSSFENGNGNILTFSDGTSQNFISNFKQSANTYGLYTVSSGALQASVAFGSAIALETKNTISMAYKASNNAASLNGAAPVLAPSGVVPVLNRLNIGSDQTLTTTNFINGHIRNVTYYNYRMPNALLQRITV